VLPLVATASATIKVVPTTTLQAETSNNTSAADSFRTQTNGNLGASNISKVDIHSLLYSGTTTKIYVHLMPWFGSGHHMEVGYSSDDPAQVHKQVVDMISRGIAGAMIDWYGPGSFSDQVTKLVMAEAETHPGFSFAIVVDKGALKGLCATCSAQDELAKQLQYVSATYFSSPAYMRLNGRPVVTNFDLDRHYTIDWNALAAVVPGNPAYIFQYGSGFTHPLSSGSYSWVGRQADFGVAYLTSFYDTSFQYPIEEAIGSAYKGFDDTLASWSLDRVLGQQCGLTWLTGFGVIRNLFNATRQLEAVQLVTWNDYEEGTEMESGIDNCLTVSASLSGSTLQWKIQGNESTLDHYDIYISTDGQNLMKLDEVALGNSTLNLTSYALDPGHYMLYVKAVGKPSILNHMSEVVKYQVLGRNTAPALALEVMPASIMLRRGSRAQSQIIVRGVQNSAALTFACVGAPANISCTFSNPKLLSDQYQAEAKLSITSKDTSDAQHSPATIGFMLMPSLGLAGIVLVRGRRQWRKTALASIFLALVALCSCGGRSIGAGVAAQSATQTVSISVNVSLDGTRASTVVHVTLF
jgi:hypothetical protein